MTATARLVCELRENARMRIDQDLEALILERYGSEPYPYIYTEQDLWEQLRKLVNDYNEEHEATRRDGAPLRGANPKGGCL
jgi:hypothetical protein